MPKPTPAEFIATLRKRLLEDKKLSPLQEYYLDHMEVLLGLGTTVSDPILEEVVHQTCRQALQEKVRLENVLFKRMEEQAFLYGALLANGMPASVFHFDDIRVGLLAVVNPRNPGQTEFARFRSEIRPDPSRER